MARLSFSLDWCVYRHNALMSFVHSTIPENRKNYGNIRSDQETHYIYSQMTSNAVKFYCRVHIELVSVFVFEKLQSRNAQQTATFIFSPLFSRPDYQTL